MARLRRTKVAQSDFFPGFDDIVEIGIGSLATVYRARELGTNRHVALKLLNVRDASPRAIESFERESIALGAVSSHPNIVTLFRSFRAGDGRPVLVLELCRGAVSDRMQDGQGLPVQDVVGLGIKIAGALETAHRAEILHRDVKPQNVLITEFGEPALADFGVAMLQSSTQTTAGLFDFTTLHAAPELLEGGETSAATDVYELASSLYQLIAGRSAFRAYDGESPASVILRILRDPVQPLLHAHVPPQLSDLLIYAMSKDKDSRPPTAAEFAAELATIEVDQGWPRTQFLIRDPSAPGGVVGLPSVTRMPMLRPRSGPPVGLDRFSPMPEPPPPAPPAAEAPAPYAETPVAPPAAPYIPPAPTYLPPPPPPEPEPAAAESVSAPWPAQPEPEPEVEPEPVPVPAPEPVPEPVPVPEPEPVPVPVPEPEPAAVPEPAAEAPVSAPVSAPISALPEWSDVTIGMPWRGEASHPEELETPPEIIEAVAPEVIEAEVLPPAEPAPPSPPSPIIEIAEITEITQITLAWSSMTGPHPGPEPESEPEPPAEPEPLLTVPVDTVQRLALRIDEDTDGDFTAHFVPPPSAPAAPETTVRSQLPVPPPADLQHTTARPRLPESGPAAPPAPGQWSVPIPPTGAPAPPAGEGGAVPTWSTRGSSMYGVAGPATPSMQPPSDLRLDPMSLRPKVTIRAGAGAALVVDATRLRSRQWLRRTEIDWSDVIGFEPRFDDVAQSGSGRLVAMTHHGPVELPATKRATSDLRYMHALLEAYRQRAGIAGHL